MNTTCDYAALAAHLPEPFREPFGKWFSLAVEHNKPWQGSAPVLDGIEALQARLAARGFPTTPMAAWVVYRALDALAVDGAAFAPGSLDLQLPAVTTLMWVAGQVIRTAPGGTLASAVARLEYMEHFANAGHDIQNSANFWDLTANAKADLAAVARSSAPSREGGARA